LKTQVSPKITSHTYRALKKLSNVTASHLFFLLMMCSLIFSPQFSFFRRNIHMMCSLHQVDRLLLIWLKNVCKRNVDVRTESSSLCLWTYRCRKWMGLKLLNASYRCFLMSRNYNNRKYNALSLVCLLSLATYISRSHFSLVWLIILINHCKKKS